MGPRAVTAARDPQTVRSLMSQPQPSAIAGASRSTQMQYIADSLGRAVRSRSRTLVGWPPTRLPRKRGAKESVYSVGHPSLQLLESVTTVNQGPPSKAAIATATKRGGAITSHNVFSVSNLCISIVLTSERATT